MKNIDIIDPTRLKEIPRKFRAHHEFCFHLHDLMVNLLRQIEEKKAGFVQFNIETEEDIELLSNGTEVTDFLNVTGRVDLERRLVINHICVALYADMLHFIYEALRALEKRKFTVALTLLRKPFKEGLLILAQMCGDEHKFFEKLKTDSKNLLNMRKLKEDKIKSLLSLVIEASPAYNFTNPDLLYEMLFKRENENGFAGLFDKATHLATAFKEIKTEDYNLNFIFKNPRDNDLFSSDVYSQIATVLLFLHMMQLSLYSRMQEPNKKYQNWMLISSVGSFEALFTKGRSPITSFVNKNFEEFMICQVCESKLHIKKIDAPRFFISERIDCKNCSVDQHFPFFWLFSKVDIDLFDI